MQKLSLIIIALIAFVQGAWAQTTNVSNETDLRNAIVNGANITLTQDITIGSAITIGDGVTVTLDLNGHTLSHNIQSGMGRIIAIDAGGTLTINDASGDNSGKIMGGTLLIGLEVDGAGIYNNGTLTINGGSITGNSGESQGGGIYNNGTLTINGGSIYGNSAGTSGGGIYNKGTLYMSGNPSITNNTCGAHANNLALDNNTVINVTGAFTSGASLGLATYNRKVTSGYSTYNSGVAPGDFFSSDNDLYSIGFNDNEVAAGYPYIECSWEGGDTDGHVVQTTMVAFNVSLLEGASQLSGWYYVDRDDTYSDNRISIDGDTHLILKDGVTLTCKKGIQIKDGYTLTIYAQSTGENMGAIKCTGDGGGVSNGNASIGGNADEMGGYLFIHGGNIYAHAYHNNAAGLGGGNHESGMRGITIYGGTIDAKGSDSGAGIGEGQQNSFNTPVTIYGGDITATGGYYAAGIGGSEDRSNGTIKIYGGTVNATGGQWGSGIGSGETGDQNNPVYIYGGNVTATGGKRGAGIGGGYLGKGGTVTIYGGTVNATGATSSAGIGGGGSEEENSSCSGGIVTVNGGNVTATGGEYAAGIGGGKWNSGGTFIANGGTVTVTSGEFAAGIGGGWKGDGGTVTINGGTLTVEGVADGNAIGSGDSNDNDGTLVYGATMRVKKDGGSWVSSGSRVTTVRHDGKYKIQECDHDGDNSYTDKDDYYHHVNCSYCEGYDEHHIKGDNDKCTKCGHALPEHAYTLYEAKADGSGYASEGTTYYVTATDEFTFPSCSVVPNKMTFAGWLLSDTEPSSLIAESTEDLIQADSTITVDMEEDRTYYARFKNTYFSGGSGTVSDPFLISDTEDWNHLAQAVNDGINFNGMYFVMTNDINVTTMAGQGSNRFRGNFDGQGHTITVSYTGITEDYCAPFRHISGATIKNLNTTGTIETSGRYAAGVVAYTRYYSKIENCHSSVVIRSSHAGWAGHGGILALKANVSYSNPTIEGCVFDGKILSTGTTDETKTTGGAGIVGYTNGQSLTIKNCLYKPAALGTGEMAVACATIYENASGSSSHPTTNVTCTDCYYTEVIGSVQGGTQAYTVQSGTEGLTINYNGTTTTYAYNGIEVYDFGLSYGGLFYSGGTTTVTFTLDLSEGYAATNVTASSGTLTDDGNYNFTLVMNNANVSITATITPIASREVAAAEDWTTASKGWVFIASPVITSEDMEPEDVSGLVAENEDDYDLYRLNPSNTKWENWKEHEGNAAAGFCLENGRGYLYATKYAMTLIFAGTFNTKDKDTIPLSPGFNLVGNPFTVAANINKPYYTLNSDGSAVQTETSSDPIPPCHGVIVQATSANDSVVFTRATQQSAVPSNSGLNIALTQANTRGASTGSAALLDNAIITFNEGSQLGKFYFGKQNANIYLPQGGEEYAIVSVGNGRDAARNVSTNEVPLNFKAKENGTYTLSVNPEGVEMGYLHLIDNMTGADVDLLALRPFDGPQGPQAQGPLPSSMPMGMSSLQMKTHAMRLYRWWMSWGALSVVETQCLRLGMHLCPPTGWPPASISSASSTATMSEPKRLW